MCGLHAAGPYLPLADQRGVPGEEVDALLLVGGHQHGPVPSHGLGLAHEAEHALVPEGGVGGARGPVFIGQLHHLVPIRECL